MKAKYTVPGTDEIGPCIIVGTSSPMESAKENALWEYNSMRVHDGLPVVDSFPKGTKREIIA